MMNSRQWNIFIQVACMNRVADNWITALYESFSDILIFQCDIKFCRRSNRVTVIDRVHEPATRPQLTDLAPMACNRCQSCLPVLQPQNRGHGKVADVALVCRFTRFNSSDHKRDHAAIDSKMNGKNIVNKTGLRTGQQSRSEVTQMTSSGRHNRKWPAGTLNIH